jgi:Zn-dependent alcohol dehydrogenase
VQEIGEGVTKVRPGDKVVLHWRKGSGIESDFPVYEYQGKKMSSGKITTFSEYSIVSENRMTVVPPETDNDFCALLGCGLSTALGVTKDIQIQDRVLVIGTGGLGSCIAKTSKGNTKTVGVGDELPSGFFDFIIDTSGNKERIETSLPLLDDGGTFIMVGQPNTDITIKNINHLFGQEKGKTIKAVQGGGFDPDTDIPNSLHINIDGLVSHRCKLENINEMLDLMRTGKAKRIMIDL